MNVQIDTLITVIYYLTVCNCLKKPKLKKKPKKLPFLQILIVVCMHRLIFSAHVYRIWKHGQTLSFAVVKSRIMKMESIRFPQFLHQVLQSAHGSPVTHYTPMCVLVEATTVCIQLCSIFTSTFHFVLIIW